MQFKVIFRVVHPGQMLPLSYQYELSSWIYSLIYKANSDFASFLHSQGYVSGHKRFKLFTFSSLWIPPKFEIIDDRIKIHSREISFVISFLVPQTAEEMIMGLFRLEQFQLGDKITQVDLQTQSIELVPDAQNLTQRHAGEQMSVRLKTTSPLMVSQPVEKADGKLWHNYVSPHDEEYDVLLLNNLRNKYQTAVAHGLAKPLTEEVDLTFQCLSQEPKRRLIRIKAHTPAETKIVGYMYDFELTAPMEYIRVGMLAGFGGENALGFGATRLLGTRQD